jgi:hypothetical protein
VTYIPTALVELGEKVQTRHLMFARTSTSGQFQLGTAAQRASELYGETTPLWPLCLCGESR